MAETVLSEKTSALLLDKSEHIRSEVSRVATDVGSKMPTLTSGDDIKSHYFDFFLALIDTMATIEQQQLFLQQIAASFPRENRSLDRSAMFARVRTFLESPVPDNFELITKASYREK